MAKYIVPPKGEMIIKCRKCKTLYVPEIKKSNSWFFCERCPTCGYEHNDESDRISLWKYNLIKYFRGGFRNEKE